MDILEGLAAAEAPLNLTEVAAQVGGSKSAVFATLQTLSVRGLVHCSGDGTDRRYELGLALGRLGSLALRRVNLHEVSRPVLESLAQVTGLTARAAAWDHDAVVVVAQVDAPDGIRFELHLAQREPLHCTSMGKACLSALDPQAAAEVVSRISLDRHTPYTVVEPERLLAQAATARELGYSVDEEEDALGILCIGAPLRDHTGGLAGAISITGVKAGITRRKIRAFGAAVRDHAAQISALLGAP